MVIACSKSDSKKTMTGKRKEKKRCDGNLMGSENRLKVGPHIRFHVNFEVDLRGCV